MTKDEIESIRKLTKLQLILFKHRERYKSYLVLRAMLKIYKDTASQYEVYRFVTRGSFVRVHQDREHPVSKLFYYLFE